MVRRGDLLVPALNCYMVAWTHNGARHVLDFNDGNEAGLISIMLEESGRSEVVVEMVQYEADAEMKKEIWERIEKRRRAEAARDALAESFGPFKEAIKDA